MGGEKVSRKLDAAIAKALEKNIRWEKTESGIGHDIFVDAMPDDRGAKPYVISQYDDCRVGEVPHYSTDGNAMLELDVVMRGLGWILLVFYAGVYCANYHNEKDVEIEFPAEANTMPKAVARAAYYVLTGKEWGG